MCSIVCFFSIHCVRSDEIVNCHGSMFVWHDGLGCTARIFRLPSFPCHPLLQQFAEQRQVKSIPVSNFHALLFNKITGVIWIPENKKRKKRRKGKTRIILYIERIRRAHFFFLFRHLEAIEQLHRQIEFRFIYCNDENDCL